MSKIKLPTTQATRILKQAKVSFESHPYTYIEAGGTASFAAEYGVDEHSVIKTLIMQDESGNPMIVLMHGDCEVSTKALARQVGVKGIRPCEPLVAERHSGYRVGGTSPFGTRKSMPVYCEATILDLNRLYINGGKRGYIISLEPQALVTLLKPVVISAIQ